MLPVVLRAGLWCLGVEPSASHLPGADVGALYGLSFDAWTDGMTGINSTALYALSVQAFMASTGACLEDFAEIAVCNRHWAQANPNAHLPLKLTLDDVAASPVVASPYRRLDCSPLSDGAAAIILARTDDLPQLTRGRSRFRAAASAVDTVRLGEREDPGFFGGKRMAAQRAYAMANIGPRCTSGSLRFTTAIAVLSFRHWMHLGWRETNSYKLRATAGFEPTVMCR